MKLLILSKFRYMFALSVLLILIAVGVYRKAHSFGTVFAEDGCECERNYCLSPPDPESCDPDGSDPDPAKSIQINFPGTPFPCAGDDTCTFPVAWGSGTLWSGLCSECPGDGDYGKFESTVINCVATCGGPPPPPPPSCEDAPPAAPTTPYPADGGAIASYSVPFSWSHSDFGENCSGGSDEYQIYIDGAYVTTVPAGTNSYIHNFPDTAYGNHTWSVVADNGNESATGGPWSFTINRHSRIIGWLWEDFDGNGAVNTNDLWSPSTISCPAANTNNNFTLQSGGNDVMGGWVCNPPSGPYLFTDYFILNNGTGQGTYTLNLGGLPTSDSYLCANASWVLRSCTNSACTTFQDYSGTGCTANNVVLRDASGINFSNILWWKIDQASRINGIVWEDLDGDNAADQPAELWSHPAIACTAPNASANISMTGASITGWGCYPNANYSTNFLSLGSNGQGTVSLTLNNRVDNTLYPCGSVAWTFLRCLNSTCAGPGNVITTTGTGCTANNLTIGEGNGAYFTNHMYWKITQDPPEAPTACLFPPAPISDIQGIHQQTVGGYQINVFPTTVGQNFSGLANDADNNLANAGIYRRPFDPITGLESDPFTQIVNTVCSGGSCNIPLTTAAIPAGYSTYFPTVSDATPASCTGRENIPVGFSDCDTGPSPDCDITYVEGDNLPVCNIVNWPADYSGPNQLVTFPTNAADSNAHTVRYNFDAACGNFKNVARITVRAQGECSGGCPTMVITATDVNGNRASSGNISVASGAPANYTWNLITSGVSGIKPMIEVRYTNDALVVGRNLRVYEVQLYEAATGTSFITMYPSQDINPQLKVFYDTANTTPPSMFDGSPVYSYDNDPADDYFRPSLGYVWMAYNGSLRFPMIWQSPAVYPGSACNISITPEVSLPYYNGATCTQSVDADFNTVSGNIFEVDGGTFTCNNPGPAIDGGTAAPQLYNGGVPIVPAGSFVGSTYTINNLWPVTTFNTLCINNPSLIGDGTQAYVLGCVDVDTPGLACSTGANGCAISCTPTNALSTGNVVINMGFLKFDNEKWFTSLDGDMYSNSIVADVSEGPADNFSSNLINRQVDAPGATIGGYGFADDIIDPTRSGSDVSEAGGSAMELGNIPVNGSAADFYDFKDKWLDTATFSPPKHPEVENAPENIVGGPNPRVQFTAGNVYEFDLEGFNDWYNYPNLTTYQLIGGGNNVAVVYVNDADPGSTIVLDHNLITFSGNDRLVIVTDLPVVVDMDFGIPTGELGSYTVLANRATFTSGVLDMILLTSQDITFESKYDLATSTYDEPVLIDGAVLARNTLNLDRNLGFINNESYPGETVRFYGRLLYRLLEADIGDADYENYTGLSTFDLQWDYGN